jgi:hypothetical protein
MIGLSGNGTGNKRWYNPWHICEILFLSGMDSYSSRFNMLGYAQILKASTPQLELGRDGSGARIGIHESENGQYGQK